jgi:hypothetical protein
MRWAHLIIHIAVVTILFSNAYGKEGYSNRNKLEKALRSNKSVGNTILA